MSAPINENLLLEAIDRIARTPDGTLFYLFCQRRLMAISTADTEGALRTDHGERRFASTLIGLMATGIAESGGRTSSGSTGGSTEQPIVFAVPKPVAVASPRGAGSRITEHTRVPGWDPPESDG